MTLKLWKHQVASVNKYMATPVVLDTSDPGTGKTLAAIVAFAYRRKHGGGCALIVAPKSLLEPAWGNDLEEFMPHLTYSVAYAKNRSAAFEVDADLYITNTDAAVWLAKQKPKFFARFDTLIIDEISYFKHRTSKRSKAMKKVAARFKYRSGLTGTPTSNSITDIWHQVLILDGGERLGKSFYQFRDAVCRPVIHPTGDQRFTKWVDKPDAHHAVAEILGDISVRHRFDDVMRAVPEQEKRLLRYYPSAKLLAHYEELKERALILLEQGEVTAVNAAALRTKLLQVASGRVYGENGARHTLDEGRNELIIELIMGRPHSVVFWNWDHQREAIVNALTKKKVDFVEIGKGTKDSERMSIMRQYQDGQFQTILMHPQSGAHGLTLTKGTSVIWCSPTDRADLLTQGDARVRRGTQRQVTESVRVCAMGTIEEKAYERTGEKLDAMNDLMELLR